jgi:hypothetical protein
MKSNALGGIMGRLPALPILAALSFSPVGNAVADDFGQIGQLGFFSAQQLWLSATGDSYIQKGFPRTRWGQHITVVRYRFRLSRDEVRRVSAFLMTHDVWHPDCRTNWYDDETITIWQRKNGVMKQACVAADPIRPSPDIFAFLHILDGVDGGQSPAIEVYRGPEESAGTPPGFPEVKARIAKMVGG